jgi:citrate lyase subunit beta/citryl-CoA lyase/(S)-citramalyl-CoA lyase
MLFVSGERPARFPKAMSSGADVVCIDLEDAVAAGNKQAARDAVFAFVAELGRAASQTDPPSLALRINGLRTRDGLHDVVALAARAAKVDYLVVPKVEHPEDLAILHGWLPEAFDGLVALVETPLGIERAFEIAGASRSGSPKLRALMLGGADLSHELGARFDWNGLLHARGRLLNAAKAAGLQAWDVPHLNIADRDGLRAEAEAVRALGYDCKASIHPAQIESIHAAFAPSAAELRWARGLLEALSAREASAQDVGAFLHEGGMVDAPVIARARRIVALAAGSAQRGKE